jgi:alpha-D-ribose 1-methylphosphonate 5-triphosphate synthase subunit PhnH
MSNAIANLRESQFDFVHDSQHTYRTIMMGLAFPGIIRRLDSRPLAISKSDLVYILQPMLTLLDLETSFGVVCKNPELQEEVTQYLAVNTNSMPRKLPLADFVLCLDPSLQEHFPQLKKGTLTQPHKGATVFYLLDSLAEQPRAGAMELNLTGPGIQAAHSVYVSGLDPAEPGQWAQHKGDYPMGIDIFLVSRSGHILGIPRSVNIATSGGL